MIQLFHYNALVLQRRKLFEALRVVDAGIALSGKVGQDIFLLNFYGFKANIQVLQGDIGRAAESLGQVKQLLSREKRVTPAHISSYRLSCFLFDVYSLGKNFREGDKLNIMQSWEVARRSGKAAVKTIAKCAIYRTETFRLMGVYYWLTGRHLRYWGNSWNRSLFRSGREPTSAGSPTPGSTKPGWWKKRSKGRSFSMK
ncbi:MAG: hypothetical protein NT166_20740 [Candidatus Aminicenantes bacterium]|nr:hypothetical protein [Candidatus Aminicenantes bacterium]